MTYSRFKRNSGDKFTDVMKSLGAGQIAAIGVKVGEKSLTCRSLIDTEAIPEVMKKGGVR